jgi:hypothetical protein
LKDKIDERGEFFGRSRQENGILDEKDERVWIDATNEE